jgi:hypothetical protein
MTTNSGDDEASESTRVPRSWQEICQEVEAVHREMAEFVDEPFRRLFVEEAEKFSQLGEPVGEAEVATRRLQRAALSGRIAALSEAGSLAKSNQHLARAIAAEAQELCRQPLPEHPDALGDYHRELVRFTARLAIVCRVLPPMPQ